MFDMSDLIIELYSTQKPCTFSIFYLITSLDTVELNPLEILRTQN